jgi:hypothetical protein
MSKKESTCQILSFKMEKKNRGTAHSNATKLLQRQARQSASSVLRGGFLLVAVRPWGV